MSEGGEAFEPDEETQETVPVDVAMEAPRKPEILKPDLLYHASSDTGILEFEPRAESTRDPSEGPVVFATPSEAFASMFIVKTDDSWTKKSRFGKVFVTVIADRERFLQRDQGGSIYTLPSETFETDPSKGMGRNEWVSKRPVKPTRNDKYSLGLDAMMALGVQVYFVGKEKFREIKEAPDYGPGILRGLESENKARGVNVKELPS